MAAKPLPSPEVLRQLLRYEPETGKLFWQVRPASMFKDGFRTREHNANQWNSTHAAKEAFITRHKQGYFSGVIHNKHLLAHRVVWAVYYGEWPKNYIDHIDGDPSNNRITNLRDVTRSQNNMNAKKRICNTSGYNGVSFVGKKNRWRATISVLGKHRTIGLFRCITAAMIARKISEKGHGFTDRHGV